MSLFVFNNSQELIKSIPDNRLIALDQEQEINKTDKLFADVPVNVWKQLKEKAFYLAVQDPYERFSFHMYKVTKETSQTDIVATEGTQVAFDELKSYGYIKDRRFDDSTVQTVAQAVVEGTDWQLGYIDNTLSKVNTNFYYISRLEALSKLLELTGAEVRFRVEITGNRIVAKRMDIYRRLSEFKGKRFVYGSKLLEVVKQEDNAELATALVGRGKGEEIDSGGYGRRITFEDVEWSKAAGDPVDKPKGQEYVELPEMTALYGYPDGTPRTSIVEFQDTEDPELLLEQTYETLVNISRPQVQFKAVVQSTGDMELGETVAIVRPDLGFRYFTRVYKIRRDYLNNSFTEVDLGDKLSYSSGDVVKQIHTSIDRRDENLVHIIQTAANGKNKIFRGSEEPAEGMMVGDLWYKPVAEGEVEMYQWNGEIWQLVVSTGVNTETAERIDEAKGLAEAAQERADMVQVDANSILAGLGVNPIGHTHADVVQAIQIGETERVNGLIDSKITDTTAQYQTLIENAQLYERVIGDTEAGVKDNVARIVMSDDIFRTEVADVLTQTSTTVEQLSDSWALSLKSGEDIKTAINADMSGLRLKGENIILDGDTVVDGTFTVTDAIFAENMNISKFTTGTLNAADVNIINLNVNNLVGNISNFVRSYWNDANSEISIDGSRMRINSSTDTIYTELRRGHVEFGDDTNTTVGHIGTAFRRDSEILRGIGMFSEVAEYVEIGKKWYGSDAEYTPVLRTAINSPGVNIFVPTGIHGTLNMQNNEIHYASRIRLDETQGITRSSVDSRPVIVGLNGVSMGSGSVSAFDTVLDVRGTRIDAWQYFNMRSGGRSYGNLDLDSNDLLNVQRILVPGGTGGITATGTWPAFVGETGVALGYGTTTSWDNKLRVLSHAVRVSSTLDMNGNEIINQSDVRLKTNIETAQVDALREVNRMEFIEFEWDKTNPANEGKPDGKHFGIKAQYSPFLQTKAGDSESYLSVDLTRQINLNSKAIQELYNEVKKLKGAS